MDSVRVGERGSEREREAKKTERERKSEKE